MIYKDETYNIVGAAIEVHRCLGRGFLESVYQEALELELTTRNIPHIKQKQIEIYYKGRQLNMCLTTNFHS